MYDFLKKVPLFADLPDEDLDRLCKLVSEVRLTAGATLFAEGSQGNHLYVVEAGQIEITKSSGGREVLLSVRGAGDVIGEMSLMDAAPRFATVRARTNSRLIAISQEQFENLLASSPSAARIILRTVTARFRNTEAALRQSEKMAQVGTITAGLAHELINPSSAAQRAAHQLRRAITKFQRASSEMSLLPFSEAQQEAISALEAGLREQAVENSSLASLEQGDREAALERWLEEIGIQDGWEIAPQLVELGLEPAALDHFAQQFSGQQLPAVLNWLASIQSVEALVQVIDQGIGRVNQIVNALKIHVYLDQAPVQEVDIHIGLHNTLILMGSRLEDGIHVRREFAPDLPGIIAYGSELNQVWMHLIDNAIAAINGKGTIIIRTRREAEWIIVEIEDDGPGIPETIQSKVFDPFFTTKPPGKGAGLGLNIVYTVVQKHMGTVQLSSRPGRTIFQVRLPLDFEHVRSKHARYPGSSELGVD